MSRVVRNGRSNELTWDKELNRADAMLMLWHARVHLYKQGEEQHLKQAVAVMNLATKGVWENHVVQPELIEQALCTFGLQQEGGDVPPPRGSAG